MNVFLIEKTNNSIETNQKPSEILGLKMSVNNFITQQINIMIITPLLAYLIAEVF